MFRKVRVGTAAKATVVAGVFSDSTALPRGLASLDASVRDALAKARKAPGFRADAGETTLASDGSVLVGLGKRDDLDGATIETVGARLGRGLERLGVRAARLVVSEVVPTRQLAAELVGSRLATGLLLANWRVNFWDGAAARPTNNGESAATLTIGSDDAACHAGLKLGLTMAEATNAARHLGATPPNICTPAYVAAAARALAKKHASLSCKVISYTEAKKLGMGGLVNVGRGSASKPCLVILEHKPARAAKDVRVALVGKTVTYDTGGYSLKVNNGMKGMKYDKLGGMAVLGAMQAIATRKLPVRTIAFLACAENMVSDDAYRPDDIITMYNGVTVEVTNTDAEGRLVLADALAYACKHYKPTAVIDAATLTGGVVVALGHFCSGVWSSDEDLFRRLEAASERTGEKVWRLPLWKAHRDFMRAQHADLWNSAPSRNAHPIQGAAFLSYFVDESVPWAHIDIAGVGSVDSDKDPYVTGPTGYGVRLLTETVAGYA